MRKEICWGVTGGMPEGGKDKQKQPLYLSTANEDVNLGAKLNPRLIKNLEIFIKYYENTVV